VASVVITILRLMRRVMIGKVLSVGLAVVMVAFVRKERVVGNEC